MGKKGKGRSGNLGKSLIRDRFGSTKIKKNSNESMLHTTEINDGYDWGRLNLQSVTEESSFQEFLSTAELAGTEFTAEKLNIKFVQPSSSGLLSKNEKDKVLEVQERNKDLVKIPRRPKWNSSLSAEELHTLEKEAFLEWRRNLAKLQEVEGLILTPYERNLEFWRQLWRVVERSDVIVQIVDARNPLLFRCEDLERYVEEINSDKLNMILLNKADFLTDEQREAWAKYFTDLNVRVAFFSATLAVEKRLIQKEDEDEAKSIDKNDDSFDKKDESSTDEWTSEFASESEYESAENSIIDNDMSTVPNIEIANDKQMEAQYAMENLKISTTDSEDKTNKIVNSSKLLNRDDLVKLFKIISNGKKTYTDGVTTIGLVGYPNVGKSSTINALLMDKKVSVSATPGKTKHFQTLYLDKDLLLCDCPGLVMPSFVCTKAEMILNGILPIDQMRDHVPPITMLATLIPRYILEDLYGFMLPVPSEGEDPNRVLTAEELLNAHGYNRGFMTQNGQPDNPRSARYVLKDFVNGRLLYCVAPPTFDQERFHKFPPRRRNISTNKHIPPRMIRVNEGCRVTVNAVDRKFFQDPHVKIREPTLQYSTMHTGSAVSLTESIDGHSNRIKKPWKIINKHVNKNKREKARRLYAHLDQH
ncbi:PREDICTED: large subunit GTPase 1 homolog [Cyphomyrmex costatus]|uniref:Large subunit GTPase 1 homolog n=1 Tax=Cyphomyrmex costatus TaxID=456900 RepID=A0A151IGF4_9HYME|nr:PREDICTED: large subunit GTPase 1 homolog [Cyphomyrmex costatus]KYN00306.1 Large subunit GTPase 1 like protein [Cyphomyrmex costatus]